MNCLCIRIQDVYWANILFWVIVPVEMLRIQYIGWVLQFSFPIQPTNDVTVNLVIPLILLMFLQVMS